MDMMMLVSYEEIVFEAPCSGYNQGFFIIAFEGSDRFVV
jgi:hypothetical protein